MTCCCFWFSQPAMETTRNENGSRPARIRRDYHPKCALRRRYESNFWTLRAVISLSLLYEAITFHRTTFRRLSRRRRQTFVADGCGQDAATSAVPWLQSGGYARG